MMTSSAARVVFPWPPVTRRLGRGPAQSISVNHMYVATGRGAQRRLSGYAESVLRGWALVVRAARLTPPPGFLDLRLDLYPPDAVRRDADGPIKLALDGLQEGLLLAYLDAGHPMHAAKKLADDYRFRRVSSERHDPDRANPRIEVAIAPWSPR